MKLDMTKEWYERRIAQEGDLEVGAGTPLEEPDVQDEPECIIDTSRPKLKRP